MGNSLAEIHTWLDDLAHGKRIANYEVMCPGTAIGLENNPDKKQLAKMWGKDPVHLAAAGYTMLAEKITEKAADLRAKSPSAFQAEHHPLRQAANLLDGVSRSDLAAPRWGGGEKHPAEEAPPGWPAGPQEAALREQLSSRSNLLALCKMYRKS